MTEHEPYTTPYAGVIDGYILRCDCGCGLFVAYPTEQMAEEAKDDG